ncbi:hypothetical protein C0989_010645 [Termitomyces sp. Mn162]|nr:hypothetical protein C0989_010645 [Termitomyces sp. Mn162]
MHLGSLWILSFPLLFSNIDARAPPGPWDGFNFAPLSRNVRPKALHSSGGNVEALDQLVPPHDGSATLIGNGSYFVLDFGQEVGGEVSLTVNKATPQSSISLSFTESSAFVSPLHSDDSCRAVPTMDSDGVQTLPFPLSPGTFVQTIGEQRGGFRYLTIVSNDNNPVTISNVSVHTTWMPHWDDLRAYNGYFFAHDPVFHDPDFLTKLWYAGAYTVQTNTIDSHQARQQPCPSPNGWANNASGGPVDGPILVDGAKRDRNIWPAVGDMGISSHTEFVALNDLLPTKNSLAVMFSTQDPNTGSLQYSGPPINAKGSDTYIGWSLIDLAARLGFTDLAASYIANATTLKSAYNDLLWDDTAGMFRDNPTSTLHPQDGNSLAVLFNVTNQQSQNAAISQGLTNFWTDIGPLNPELNDTIIPFVSGFEVKYRYRAAAGYHFDHSYTSHSHGWATGPTPALTFFVLGLTPTSAQGATWSLAPMLSGLDGAEGGFTTSLGWFGVKWEIRDTKLMLAVDVPESTRGTIQLPGTGPIHVEGGTFSILPEDGKLEIQGGNYTLIQVL